MFRHVADIGLMLWLVDSDHMRDRRAVLSFVQVSKYDGKTNLTRDRGQRLQDRVSDVSRPLIALEIAGPVKQVFRVEYEAVLIGFRDMGSPDGIEPFFQGAVLAVAVEKQPGHDDVRLLT